MNNIYSVALFKLITINYKNLILSVYFFQLQTAFVTYLIIYVAARTNFTKMAESLQNSVPNIQAVHINLMHYIVGVEGIYTQYGIEVNLNVTLYDILLNMDNLKLCFVVFCVTCARY